MNDRKCRVTGISKIGEMINSQYGNIPYLDWCNKEAARINAHRTKTVHVVEEHGFCYISR